MPAEVTQEEYLNFDEVAGIPDIPLNTPAWQCLTYMPLYDVGPVVPEDDRVIPGVAGRLYVPREIDEMTISLRLDVFGEANYEGTAWPDAALGLRHNLRFLRTNLLEPQDQERPVTFHQLGGITVTGNVVILPPMSPVIHGYAWAKVVLNLKILEGGLY